MKKEPPYIPISVDMPIACRSRYNPCMRITLLYFAAARERAGTSRETLELLPDATARTALEAACANHPALAAIAHLLRVAVDQEFAAPDKALRDGCEVALIPPVSGGI